MKTTVWGIFAKILGFLVIIITLALGPTIYTSNAAIVSANLTGLIGMSVVAGFGAFIIIFGLLIGGGVLAIATSGGGDSAIGKGEMLKVILSVVVIVIMLSMFTNVITYCNALIGAAITAGDTLGEVGFGIIPIVVYVGILSAAGWTQVAAIRKVRRAKRASRRGYL